MSVTPSTPAYRFVGGVSEETTILAPPSVMINEGDLIWNNAGVAAVCSTSAYSSTTGAQQTFRSNFLGVSKDNRLSTDTSTDRYISVITKGKFNYPCAALGQAYHIGTFVAPAKDTGSNLLDQQLAITSTTGQAISIGVLSREAASGATSIEVELQSYLLFGGFAS